MVLVTDQHICWYLGILQLFKCSNLCVKEQKTQKPVRQILILRTWKSILWLERYLQSHWGSWKFICLWQLFAVSNLRASIVYQNKIPNIHTTMRSSSIYCSQKNITVENSHQIFWGPAQMLVILKNNCLQNLSKKITLLLDQEPHQIMVLPKEWHKFDFKQNKLSRKIKNQK